MALSLEQTRYLQERGFEAVNGEPSSDEAFPHIILREPQQHVAPSEISYRLKPYITVETYVLPDHSAAHPSTIPASELVDFIEKTVADFSDLDGKLFHTTPGKPIRIFVTDPAWEGVAAALAAKYN